MSLGQKEKGLEWASRALAMGPDDDGILYNVACVFSLAGDAERALDCLEGAVRNGFTGRAWIEHDTDLDAVLPTQRFRDVLAAMRDSP